MKVHLIIEEPKGKVLGQYYLPSDFQPKNKKNICPECHKPYLKVERTKKNLDVYTHYPTVTIGDFALSDICIVFSPKGKPICES